MKIPSGFFDINGKAAKGQIFLTTGEDQNALSEFGTISKGNKISCYVLTSPGDIPTLRFTLNANIADHGDFVVDGVLRNCYSTTLSKAFKGAFGKALYQGRKSAAKRAAVKYSKMKVKERGTIKDMISTNSNSPSAVGSFEMRLYRTDPGASDQAAPSDGEAAIPEHVDRSPAFDKCPEWFDCNSNLNFEGPPPPFQIEFFDHKEATKIYKEKVLKDLPTTCKLWATFVFHLRSTADLQQLGFDCPTYYSNELAPSPDLNLKAESNVTSLGNALVKELTTFTPEKMPADTEVQRTKSPTRPVPIMAPPTTVTGLLFPEPVTATMVFKNSKEAIRPKQEPADEHDTPRNSVEKDYAVLHGVGTSGTSPAHKAFLERPATQETESRLGTPVHDEAFGVDGDVEMSSQWTMAGGLFPRRRPVSEPPEVLTSMKGGRLSSSGSQGEMVDTIWKPWTPPVASFKHQKQSVQRGHAGLDNVWGRSNIALSTSSEGQLSRDDSRLPDTFQVFSQNSNQQNGSFVFTKPAVPDLCLQKDSRYQVGFSRATSEAPSDTTTEVADPEDIERAVRASQRSTQDTHVSEVPPNLLGLGISLRSTDAASMSSKPNLTFKSEPLEDELGNHTYPSPILGVMPSWSPRSSFGGSQSFMDKVDNESPTGRPGQQARQYLKNQTPTSTPQIPPHKTSSTQPSPGPKHSLLDVRPVTPADVRVRPVEKRKADLITGNPEGSPLPSKATINPASRNFDHIKAERLAAETRVATAQKKKEELKKKLRAAEAMAEQRKMIHDLNERAAEVERENEDIEARIASIYDAECADEET